MTNAEARFNNSLRPRKPEGSLGRTAQDGHLDSHTAPDIFIHIYMIACHLQPVSLIINECAPFLILKAFVCLCFVVVIFENPAVFPSVALCLVGQTWWPFTLLAFRAEYYSWCSDWLKLVRRLTARTPCCLSALVSYNRSSGTETYSPPPPPPPT